MVHFYDFHLEAIYFVKIGQICQCLLLWQTTFLLSVHVTDFHPPYLASMKIQSPFKEFESFDQSLYLISSSVLCGSSNSSSKMVSSQLNAIKCSITIQFLYRQKRFNALHEPNA